MNSLPETVVKDVEAMMSKFDKNNDHQLDWDEVIERLKANGSKDPEFATFSMFFALDKDYDGKISLSEVKAHKLDIYAKKCEKIIKKDITNILKEYDSNKDGKITWDEVVKVFGKDKECSNPESSAHYLFRSIDENNDREITIDEIKDYSKRFNNLYPAQ